jgi:hypothetical protein
MVGRATLDGDDEDVSFFFLNTRIFCRAAATMKPPAQPSGFVPGWDLGGTAVFSGLDRVCEVLFRVLVVIFRGLCVISFYFWASI